MKIGFDGKRTTQNLTGLGNYGRYIIRLLANHYPENQYVVYALKAPSRSLSITGVEYRYPEESALKSYWRSFGVVKSLVEENIGLYHGLSNEIPFRLTKNKIPSVVTIHDLIFIRYPQYYSFFDRIIYKVKFRHAALKADKIIAISEQTKRDIMNYFGISDDRIEVIYQNCDPIFRKAVPDPAAKSVREKYNLPEKYLLNVGTIEERKNVMIIVQALTKLDHVHLVIVGKETSYAQKVKEYVKNHDMQSRVHFLANVSHIDLPAIYQLADLFIYPSRFEGFGIPIIEALHSRVPVIAATGSCLEEAGGPSSVYIDPDDPNELVMEIERILADDQIRRRMISVGVEYLKNFEDEKIAGQVMRLYQNLTEHA